MSKWGIYGYICIIISDIFGIASLIVTYDIVTPWMITYFILVMLTLLIIAAFFFLTSGNSSYIKNRSRREVSQ